MDPDNTELGRYSFVHILNKHHYGQGTSSSHRKDQFDSYSLECQIHLLLLLLNLLNKQREFLIKPPCGEPKVINRYIRG